MSPVLEKRQGIGRHPSNLAVIVSSLEPALGFVR
jgi:hypothetical protein